MGTQVPHQLRTLLCQTPRKEIFASGIFSTSIFGFSSEQKARSWDLRGTFYCWSCQAEERLRRVEVELLRHWRRAEQRRQGQAEQRRQVEAVAEQRHQVAAQFELERRTMQRQRQQVEAEKRPELIEAGQ